MRHLFYLLLMVKIIKVTTYKTTGFMPLSNKDYRVRAITQTEKTAIFITNVTKTVCYKKR